MATRMKSGIRNRYLFVLDIFLIALSVALSFMIRFEFESDAILPYLTSAYWMLGVSLVLKLLVYYLRGLYRHLWIYASVNEMKLIVFTVSIASAAVAVLMYVLLHCDIFTAFPRSVPVIDWLISILFVGGSRFSVRFFASADSPLAVKPAEKNMKRALIIGAGDAGAIVCREIQKNPQLQFNPIGFVDDDEKKLNQEIYGVKVLGKIQNIAAVIEKNRVESVLFAIPSAPGRVIRLVSEVCRQKNIPFRTMPGIYELIGGRVNISRLHKVEITDLLRRDPVKLDQDNIGPLLRDKVVLITGAGGSIGQEITRQVARWNPRKILALGHGENSVFGTMLTMQREFPELDIEPLIVDVRDQKRVNWVFETYHPQIVFHAAAHKHVHLMEVNIPEAITNNVFGTQNVVKAAKSHQAEHFVMISTDKAVRPVNIMGASKRLAENIVLNEAKGSDAHYTVVRFGNVLGSRGSVVPIFEEQIRKGGPITVTDPQMERYFMTIPEAVYLVLEAAGLSRKQETFVLDMGKQVRIMDLAEDMIRLSGLEPGRDIEIKFTGMRPGEKLSEDLWNEGQVLEPTVHPDIFQLERTDLIPPEELDKLVEQLRELADNEKEEEIRALLHKSIPDATLIEEA